MKELSHIGRAILVDFPDLGIQAVPAKVDTGADVSSIWVNSVSEQADGLHCVFFGEKSHWYTGETVVIPAKSYTTTRVSSSFGNKEIRYKLKLRVRVDGRLINATFTLSDRSQKLYPVLLGRRLLSGKFIVDVRRGEPQRGQEIDRKKKLDQFIKSREIRGTK